MEQPDNMVARSTACSGSFHCIAALGHAMLLATSLAAANCSQPSAADCWQDCAEDTSALARRVSLPHASPYAQ